MKAGEIVSIRHYSAKAWFKSVVLLVDNKFIIVKLTKDFAVLNFLKGDPVVLGFEDNGEIHVAGCSVSSLDPDGSYVKLAVESCKSIKEQRDFERFPVSFYTQIRSCDDSDKVYIGTVKNMSCEGMLMISSADLERKKPLEITIYPTFQEVKIDDALDKTIIYLRTEIARKIPIGNRYEYALKITNIDAHSQNMLRLYLQNLKSMQIEFLKDLKEKK